MADTTAVWTRFAALRADVAAWTAQQVDEVRAHVLLLLLIYRR